jgi:hypothetical protein
MVTIYHPRLCDEWGDVEVVGREREGVELSSCVDSVARMAAFEEMEVADVREDDH